MFFRLAAPAALATLLVAAPVLAVHVHEVSAATAGVSAAQAEKPAPAPPFALTNGWVREAPPGAEVMAAYFTLKNTSGKAVTLKGVSSPLFERVEMHEVKQEGGRVKMQEVERFTLKPGESLTLAPGGAHLMMFTPTRSLKSGEKVSFILDFGTAGKLNAQLPVQRKAPGGEAHEHHDHGGDHHHH